MSLQDEKYPSNVTGDVNEKETPDKADGSEYRTDVRQEQDRPPNVSRETSKRVAAKKRIGGGKDGKEGRKETDTPTVRELYKGFRENGLSAWDSFYNAAYLKSSDNYYSSDVPVKKEYEHIYAHPKAWFKNQSTLWTHNRWSVLVKIMECLPKISGVGQKTAKTMFNGAKTVGRAFEYSGHFKLENTLFLVFLLTIVAATAAVGYGWHQSVKDFKQKPALELYIDGGFVGCVPGISAVEKSKEKVENMISVTLGTGYGMDGKFEYKATRVNRRDVLDGEKLDMALMEYADSTLKQGYGLYVYDVLVCAVGNKAWIDEAAAEYLKLRQPDADNDGYVDSSLSNIRTAQGYYPEELFYTKNDVRRLFSLPIMSEEDISTFKTPPAVLNHEVNSGEVESTFNSPENTEGVTSNSDEIVVSESTMVVDSSNMLGVSSDVSGADGQNDTTDYRFAVETVTTRSETVVEKIPYSIEAQYDDSLRADYREVVSKGKEGTRQVVYLVRCVGDDEVRRDEISSVELTAPVSEKIIVGTRPLTEEEKRTLPTGTYVYPCYGSFSSRYGWRTWSDGSSEFHKGVDFQSDGGRHLDIFASDGGKVVQAGDRGDGYGLCIIIDHGNGVKTRYAHCSELYVAQGDHVAQGELMAKMGQTGWANGVHLHFEVIVNGRHVNPVQEGYLEPR